MRESRFDNLRFLLIILVVFGHLLELFSGGIQETVYRVIYSFHMPAFIFITGYFAMCKARTIARLIFTYLVFQTLYLAFSQQILGGETTIALQYSTPYWLLWYLLAIIAYHLAIPLLQTSNGAQAGAMLLASLAIALWAGTNEAIGYTYSLSRILCFLPFFAMRYYAKSFDLVAKVDAFEKARFVLLTALLTLVIAYVHALLSSEIPTLALYGSYSYLAAGYSMPDRAFLLAGATLWILLILLAVPQKRIPFISSLGRYTLPVFLLHGFLVKTLATMNVFIFSEAGNIAFALLLTALIVLALGNKVFDCILRLGVKPQRTLNSFSNKHLLK